MEKKANAITVEEIKNAYKLFGREDLIDDDREDLDCAIQTFLTTREMVEYMNLKKDLKNALEGRDLLVYECNELIEENDALKGLIDTLQKNIKELDCNDDEKILLNSVLSRDKKIKIPPSFSKRKIDNLEADLRTMTINFDTMANKYLEEKSNNNKAIEYINIFKNDIRGLDDVVLIKILEGSD